MAIKLTYFDFSGSRGDECRLALHIAGVAFQDNRIKFSQWQELKPSSPWGTLPILEVDGRVLGQSNAILTWIGLEHGMLPTDPWERARHLAVLAAGEELRHSATPVMAIKEEPARKEAREAFAEGYMQRWGASVEAQLGDGLFMAGERISVADLKLYCIVRWCRSGVIDHVRTDVFSGYPKLEALFQAVHDHPAVKSWAASVST